MQKYNTFEFFQLNSDKIAKFLILMINIPRLLLIITIKQLRSN